MTSTLRRAILPGVAALLAVSVTACGSSSSNDATDGSSDGSNSGSGGGSLTGTLNGGGSTAQTAAQMAWTAGFQTANSGVTVNYDPVGSGDGRTGFFSGKYTFAGSDSALSATASDGDEIAMAKKTCNGEDAIEVPAYISAIAIVYKLDGVSKLQLSPATVADIFSGKITSWDDSEIKADNPGVDLPSTKITPVHRSDDSGTTANFTDYLSKASDGAWTKDPDDTWPYSGGASGNGTSGLVDAVKGGNGTIGYADLSQSTGLGVADLKVGDTYVTPSASTAAQALADSTMQSGRPDGDIAYDINRTDDNSSAYPLILTSYLIACPSGDQADLVKGYLTYATSTDGQQQAASAAGSAPLPDAVASEITSAIDMIGG